MPLLAIYTKIRPDLTSCNLLIEIKKDVKQGYVLSPILFNLYSENIITRALSELDDEY